MWCVHRGQSVLSFFEWNPGVPTGPRNFHIPVLNKIRSPLDFSSFLLSWDVKWLT